MESAPVASRLIRLKLTEFRSEDGRAGLVLPRYLRADLRTIGPAPWESMGDTGGLGMGENDTLGDSDGRIVGLARRS